jgi:hypothetical protein
MVGDNAGKERQNLWMWLAGFTAFSAIYRLVPYYLPNNGGLQFVWNLAPIGALGLFAGCKLRGWIACMIPLVALFISDLLITIPLAKLDPALRSISWMTLVTYGCFALYAIFGWLIPRGKTSPLLLGGAALLASMVFFLVSNFAVWLGGDAVDYPRTMAGLATCYWKAIPFHRNTLAGDLIFSGLFFGFYALAQRVTAPGRARQTA